MANTYSTEAQLLQNTPRQMPNGSYAGGRMRRYRNTIALAAQAAADTITLLPVPAGQVFAFGIACTDTSLGSTTFSVGVSGTAAKYRALAVLTATDTPTLFGKAGALDDDFLTATETPIITLAAATAPGSGILVVDMYYSGQ